MLDMSYWMQYMTLITCGLHRKCPKQPPTSNKSNVLERLAHRPGWLKKGRHLVECFFNKLRRFRHIVPHCEKTPNSFEAFVKLHAQWRELVELRRALAYRWCPQPV